MTLFVKFIGAFATIGAVLSLLAGFLGGNRWSSVLIGASICIFLSALLGAGTYKILELKVPEFFELFSQESYAYDDLSDSDEYEAEPLEPITGFGDHEDISLSGVSDAPISLEGTRGVAPVDVIPNSGKFGDHLLVQKVKIKNEPKLMARAVREMLLREQS